MPTDTTPDPRDMERMPETQQIPQATREVADKPDIRRRPALPEQPRTMTADVVEDEGADPVVESGPTESTDRQRERP
ncbi:hypothetical protein EZ313_08100 [Ramlibacter henchirensis]|uniref:Uncharacterized protein n=1 Tax=Ramlibacter henchirensis TaxID=204072 RepID=A0A4Z0C926_9BURK|nr:hypothetical protein [Ramlibacter henchirensis]TFZ06579.1 hypothetical protein EZ313_08100 [Ramlibacter henchirensis]